ncbi:hypothetical protein MMPV_005220 [Pyropia vietnamensis]
MAAAFTPLGIAVLADVRTALTPHASPRVAAGQSAYLLHKFPALGVYTPARRAATRPILRALPARAGAATWGWPTLAAIADALWAGAPEREFPHTACDVLSMHRRVWLPRGDPPAPSPSTAEVLAWVHAKLVSPVAHWDVVDFLATTVVGDVLRRDERSTAAVATAAEPGSCGTESPAARCMRDWLTSEVVWVRRTAVLAQLKSHSDTNVPLLQHTLASCAAEREFFVAKAVGWALREYRRTDRGWVDAFVAAHPMLSPLARREALKHDPELQPATWPGPVAAATKDATAVSRKRRRRTASEGRRPQPRRGRSASRRPDVA